jgi:trimethylamine---corrinoid protein Co-methyltransferase
VAGWLEAGLVCGYSKFVTDADQLVGWYKYAQGISFDDFDDAMQAVREVGPAGHFLGTAHTLEHFERAFFTPELMDFNSFEQWSAEGSLTMDQRGNVKARAMLNAYVEPKLDEAVAEELAAFVAQREAELPDTLS